jgi:hypothetical protein
MMPKKSNGPLKKTDRIFTDDELKEFSKGFMDMAIEAIDAGDLEKAKGWCRHQAEAQGQIHDVLVNFVAGLLSYIYDHEGEESAVNAIREVMGKVAHPDLIALRKKDLREWVTWCVEVARQHSADPGITVEEDDEKFIITVKCGSGGKLIETGAYDGPNGYRKLRKPGPQTWGEADMPIYCGHCPVAHEILPIQIGGQGSQFWVHAVPFPKNPGDPCIHHIYKNPADIPEKYYKRLGLEKMV